MLNEGPGVMGRGEAALGKLAVLVRAFRDRRRAAKTLVCNCDLALDILRLSWPAALDEGNDTEAPIIATPINSSQIWTKSKRQAEWELRSL